MRAFAMIHLDTKSYVDCCIAAVAIRAQAALPTNNRADFTPLTPHGLVLA